MYTVHKPWLCALVNLLAGIWPTWTLCNAMLPLTKLTIKKSCMVCYFYECMKFCPYTCTVQLCCSTWWPFGLTELCCCCNDYLGSCCSLKVSTLVRLHLEESGLKHQQWLGTLWKHIHVLLMFTEMYLGNKTKSIFYRTEKGRLLCCP